MDVFQLHVLDNILGVKENYFKIRIQVLPYISVFWAKLIIKKKFETLSRKESLKLQLSLFQGKKGD